MNADFENKYPVPVSVSVPLPDDSDINQRQNPAPVPVPVPVPVDSGCGSFQIQKQQQRSATAAEAPKGRQKLAWGVSPRNATTTLVSALKGRQIPRARAQHDARETCHPEPALRARVEGSPARQALGFPEGIPPLGPRRPSVGMTDDASPEGAIEISLGRQPQDSPTHHHTAPEGRQNTATMRCDAFLSPLPGLGARASELEA